MVKSQNPPLFDYSIAVMVEWVIAVKITLFNLFSCEMNWLIEAGLRSH